MFNKKIISILTILILFLMIFNVMAEEEQSFADKVYEKIENYEEETAKNERIYNKLVEDQGIRNEKPEPIAYYDHGYTNMDYYTKDYEYLGSDYDYSYLGNKYNNYLDKREVKVEIPVRYSTFYGRIKFKILKGTPLSRIQFSEEFRFVFPLSEKIGLTLTEDQITEMYEKEKVYTIDHLLDIGDIVYRTK